MLVGIPDLVCMSPWEFLHECGRCHGEWLKGLQLCGHGGFVFWKLVSFCGVGISRIPGSGCVVPVFSTPPLSVDAV